jgi:hypothetical protein
VPLQELLEIVESVRVSIHHQVTHKPRAVQLWIVRERSPHVVHVEHSRGAEFQQLKAVTFNSMNQAL